MNDNLQKTCTDRLLDQSLYNPTSHNVTTTLTRRAQLDYALPDSLQDKTDYLNNIFSKTTTTRTLLDGTLTVTFQHSDQLKLWSCYDSNYTVHQRHYRTYTQSFNTSVAHKPVTALRWLLTNVKDKDKPEDRQGAVYKIKCCNCQASYIGETGRNLSMRLTEHKCTMRIGDINESHCWALFMDKTLTGTLQ